MAVEITCALQQRCSAVHAPRARAVFHRAVLFLHFSAVTTDLQ